jgi:hypothetical protein
MIQFDKREKTSIQLKFKYRSYTIIRRSNYQYARILNSTLCKKISISFCLSLLTKIKKFLTLVCHEIMFHYLFFYSDLCKILKHICCLFSVAFTIHEIFELFDVVAKHIKTKSNKSIHIVVLVVLNHTKIPRNLYYAKVLCP